MPIRPTSSVCMQILKSLPSCPSRFSFGTILSVNTISEVWTPCSPHLIFDLPDGKAGESAFDDEGGEPLRPLGLVRHGEDDEHARFGAVRDENIFESLMT